MTSDDILNLEVFVPEKPLRDIFSPHSFLGAESAPVKSTGTVCF